MDSCVVIVSDEIHVVVEDNNDPTIVKVFEGVPGPPGPSASDDLVKYVAGSPVNGFQLLFITGDNRVAAANAQNETHAGRVVGFSVEPAEEGAFVKVRRSGSVENQAWSLDPGRRYYLQAGGEIGTETDGVLFVQKVGIAESTTKLFVQIDPPIIV